MVYLTSCFSGECGFCANCCANCANSCATICATNCEKDNVSKVEVLRRAGDLSKFLGKNRIDKITMDYNKDLKRWCSERGFRNPINTGSSKETILVKNGEVIFNLVKEKHKLVCDGSLCKAMYVNCSERLHSTFYPSLPIYTNGKLNFCGPCFTRTPTPPDISDY
jgi:hypothetical protein